MTRTLLIFICFFSFLTTTLAQKTYYLGINNEHLSIQEFNKAVVANNAGWAYERTDTALLVRIAPVFYQGKLPSIFVTQMRTALERYSKIKIDSSAILYVTYSTGIEHRLRKSFRLLKKVDHHQIGHFKELKKIANIAFFNIYKSDLPVDSVYTNLMNNYRDSENIFVKYFELQYPLFSDIMVRPDGRYFILYGVTVNRINAYDSLKALVKID